MKAGNDRIFLLLGSNQGTRSSNLDTAAAMIEADAGTIVARSSVYQTAAWGRTDQPDFYNRVLEIRSWHSPGPLLKKLLETERSMGRVRVEKWGPRIIDIDILFFGDKVIDTPELKIPHPGIPERRFTLLPLAEIAAELIHPVSGKSIATLLRDCADTLPVEKVSQP